MEEEDAAAVIGALSAFHAQLQEVERSALKRARAFRKEADHMAPPRKKRFETAEQMLLEIRGGILELREYIDTLVDYLRAGGAQTDKRLPKIGYAELPERTEGALEDAAVSFQKAANALHVVGRALETEDMDAYADHLHNLSESVEAEAQRAKSVLDDTSCSGYSNGC